MSKTAIIIGAGPAGLTAAYELITKTSIIPVIIEKTMEIGGISRTVNYRGNRMDIGGHRFFSKSDIVMKWWLNILPVQGFGSENKILTRENGLKTMSISDLPASGPDPDTTDRVMLVRNRLSRIYFLGKLFDYPVSLNWNTFSNLGIFRLTKILWSYLIIRISPNKKIDTLEDFLINRFGSELYKTFFKDYTEKVWGIACSEIPSDWGSQRIKDLSVSRALKHAIKTIFRKEKTIDQKRLDTSLIERFLYPKLGPGLMWESVARIIEEKGGRIIRNSEVIKLSVIGNEAAEVTFIDYNAGSEMKINGDFFFSSMPVRDLINAMGAFVPADVKEISDGLLYRDFITVGLLLNKLKIKNSSKYRTHNGLIRDNWIYIQERNVKVGRLQIFNNWSPYLVADRDKVWIGLEYFCNEGDELWSMNDSDFIQFAINELTYINIIDKDDVIDGTLIRMPKTYPAYFGTYNKFYKIRNFTDKIENLFLIGRNGMHKYNNQDHSMLTAIEAVKKIMSGDLSKNSIWEINTEEAYNEEK